MYSLAPLSSLYFPKSVFTDCRPSLRTAFLPNPWVPKSCIPFISNVYCLSSAPNPQWGDISPFLEFIWHFIWTFSCSPFKTCIFVLSLIADCYSLLHSFLYFPQCQTQCLTVTTQEMLNQQCVFYLCVCIIFPTRLQTAFECKNFFLFIIVFFTVLGQWVMQLIMID